MNFDNLFAVECKVRCDQNKLQSILRTLEERVRHVESQIGAVDRRCEHLELTDLISDRKFVKFEAFTIENLRSTVDKISSLNFSFSKYVGKDPCVYETSDGTIVPIDPKQQFEDRLAQYAKQIQEIDNHKLVKTQLSFTATLMNKESQKPQSKISEKYTQFELISDEVKKIINQKFQEYKQELTKGKKVFFNHEIQDNLSKQVQCHRPSVSKFVDIQNDKDSSKLQNASGMRPSMLELLDDDTNGMSYGNFGKLQSNMEFQDVKNDDDIMKNKYKNYPPPNSSSSTKNLKEEIQRLKDSFNRGITENQKAKQAEIAKQNQAKIKELQALSEEALQEMTLKIKREFGETIRNELSKIVQKVEDLTTKNQLGESNMTFLMKEFRLYKNDLEKLFTKTQEIQQKISTTLSEFQDKHLNVAGRIREHQLKINQLEITSLNQGSFRESDYAPEGSVEGRKFKEIGNFKKSTQYDPMNINLNSGSGVRILSSKYQTSGSNLASQSQIVSKLNSLSEKVQKIEEKLKNYSVNPSQKNLPKIDTGNSSSKNIQSSLLEQLRKDILKTNDELSKTNERVQAVRKSLLEVENVNQQIPKQIQKIEMDLHNINEIQENRLIDLIKDIINKVLTDPFNNNFTNVLKREINAKFLEIKHEYASIMKDIESRVMDRADISELQKIKDFVETNAIELKTLVFKKADNEDFKKGLKYLDQKLKDLYSYVKDMDEEDINNNPRPQTQSSAYTRTGFLRSKKQP